MGPFRLSKEMKAVDTVAGMEEGQTIWELTLISREYRMEEGQTIWGLTLISREYQAVVWIYLYF